MRHPHEPQEIFPKHTFRLGYEYTRTSHPKYKYKLLKPITLPMRDRDLIPTGPSALAPDGTPWVCRENGVLKFAAGFMYDGPSGVARDDEETMFPSLIHDGLYQLGRDGVAGGYFKSTALRLRADWLMGRLMREQGAGYLRSGTFSVGLTLVGGLLGMWQSGGYHGTEAS